MSLTVLYVAYPFAPVAPHAVGGSEQIIRNLDEGLVAAGHKSLVLACEGSRTAGRLISTPKLIEDFDDAGRRWYRIQFQTALDRALATHSVDLIHMHGFDFHEYRLPKDIPVLVTLHMPIEWYPAHIWTRFGSNVHFQCVSHSQQRSCPAELGDVPVVENGIPLPPLRRRKCCNFALALGRICPEKNFHIALEAGSHARIPVLIGGQVFPYQTHLEYFRDKIEPALHTQRPYPKHKFLGPLSPTRKRRLLSRARCLLHPSLAPETSSLVAMEALASGVPVIAFRSGALPDIVEHNVTGFLVDNAEEMAAAIQQASTISPEACRSTAERRFDQSRMITQYISLYERVTAESQMLERYA